MFPDLPVGRESFTTADDTPAEAACVVEFWQEAGPDLWFAKDAGFDCLFHTRFLSWHEKAAGDELAGWRRSTCGALALLLLLDQFPRNIFRGSGRAFESNDIALEHARAALDAGFDRQVDAKRRQFFYLPFEHSESLADQDRAIALFAERMPGENLIHAQLHRDTIATFGRFPWRNAALGRPSTPEEQALLDAGGYGALVSGKVSLADAG